jgi:hypothetical protein
MRLDRLSFFRTHFDSPYYILPGRSEAVLEQQHLTPAGFTSGKNRNKLSPRRVKTQAAEIPLTWGKQW